MTSSIPPTLNTPLPPGREHIIEAIYQSISGNEVQGAKNVVIQGAPYIGKSDILHQLLNIEMRQKYLREPHWLPLLFFDGADLIRESHQVLRHLGNKLLQIFDVEWKFTRNQIINDACKQLNTSEDPLDVRDGFKDLLDEIDQTYKRFAVFVFDHFEELIALFTVDEIQYIRDVFSNSRHGLVVAVPRPIDELTPKTFPSKLERIFGTQNVTGLTYVQADTFLSDMGFKYTEKQQIISFAGTHPFLLKYLGNELKNYQVSGRDSVETNELVFQGVRRDLEKVFRDIWLDMSDPLKVHLYRFLTSAVNITDIMPALSELEHRYGLVYRQDGTYKISGSMFRDFVLTQTTKLNDLLKTNTFESSLYTLKASEIRYQYRNTDPSYYYQLAYERFGMPSPNYKDVNNLLHKTFDGILDMLVDYSEEHSGHFFDDIKGDYQKRIDFIARTFELAEHLKPMLKTFWDLSIQYDTTPSSVYDTQWRFCTLAGIIQYILNISPTNRQTTISDNIALDFDKGIEGGTAIVSYYYDRYLDRKIAVKKLKNQKQEAVNELIRGARIQTQLNHPNIAKVISVREMHEHGVVMEMEWIEGQSLYEYFENNQNIDLPDALNISIQVAEGLAYAHDKGIIHRDIKFKNIILNPDGKPIIIDFGIAHSPREDTIQDAEDFPRMTQQYAAPEQFPPAQYGITPKVDVFSLGIVLYRLITRHFPFPSGNNPHIYQGKMPRVESPSDLPTAIQDLLCDMLAWKPDDRLTSREAIIRLQSIMAALKE